MKLADVSPEVRAELNVLRRIPVRGGSYIVRHPEDGSLWFDPYEHKAYGGRYGDAGYPCGVCGLLASVWDHCHSTGFIRARLCSSCNISEGFHGGPMWDLYRHTAPLLDRREQYGSYEPRCRLDAEELATLPMDDLLRINHERRFPSVDEVAS